MIRLNISDKVILLHRENEQEQIDSWLNAKTTGNWALPWALRSIEDKQEEKSFKEVKKVFKEKYLDEDYFKVSYEELYYGDGFKKVLEYLNIEGLENKNFPYGKKYRVDLNYENREQKFI